MTTLDSNDVKWVLKIIRESCNLRGIELEQAGITIQKLQSMLTEMPNNKEKENEE